VDCIHFWRIDRNNQGVCAKCGERRDFQALLLKRKAVPPYANPHNARE